MFPWSNATAPLAAADGEVSLGRRGREGGLVPGCGRVCGCQGHRLGKSANHSLEALELILHPTAAFSALDENVAVCPVQVHDELWCSLTVHWHSLAQGWQTHTAICRCSEAPLLGDCCPYWNPLVTLMTRGFAGVRACRFDN